MEVPSFPISLVVPVSEKAGFDLPSRARGGTGNSVKTFDSI